VSAPETDGSLKSGARAGFFVDLAGKASETGLAGWRRSAEGALLRPYSLL